MKNTEWAVTVESFNPPVEFGGKLYNAKLFLRGPDSEDDQSVASNSWRIWLNIPDVNFNGDPGENGEFVYTRYSRMRVPK